MPVTIAPADAISSNKPPAPEPIPSKELFPTHMVLEDGREIWVSVPQPDRLSLVIPISKYVYGKNVSPDLPVSALLDDLKALIFSEFHGKLVGKPKDPPSSLWSATIELGGRQSRVTIQRHNHKKYGKECLRLDLNPRKLKPAGFAELRKLLSHGGQMFNLGKLLKAAKVTRYDVAIDIVGVQVSEIVAIHKPEGKRSYYVGNDGVLETVYIHKKVKPPKAVEYDDEGISLGKPKRPSKPAGAVALAIYDRLRERKALGLPGPFGEAPISRVEIAKTTLKKTWLSDLADLTDALENVRVGLGISQTDHSSLSWNRFMTVRRVASNDDAASILGLPLKTQKSLEAGLSVPMPNLVAPKLNWSGWIAGLKLTGLASLIAEAKTAPEMASPW
jgi:hypothetical protein